MTEEYRSYPKINTLWKREQDGKKKGCIIPGEYSEPEFESINLWSVKEKIDGMNIRIIRNNSRVFFHGRTDKTEIPHSLNLLLEKYFTEEKFEDVFENDYDVTLFGEGYGKKIQEPCGKKYIPDGNDFILFDVLIGGSWLEVDNVIDIAKKFGINHVPYLGIMTKDEVLKLIKNKKSSGVSELYQIVEGYVCTSYPMMCYRTYPHNPIKFKIKVSDYDKLNMKMKINKGE